VYKILDRYHYLLSDLTGKVLPHVFHYNRLKSAFMKTTGSTNITNLDKLKQALQQQPHADDTEPSMHCASKYIFSDQNGSETLQSPQAQFVYVALDHPVDLDRYSPILQHNNGLAARTALSATQQNDLFNALVAAPSGDTQFTLRRVHFKSGHLQVLLSMPLATTCSGIRHS
jgi:hypothetical protein